MRLLGLAGLVGACLATSPLFAADLFDSAPPPMDAPAGQTELGSNWYIRGDVGYGAITESTVVPTPGMFPATSPFQTGSIDPTTQAFVPATATFNGAPTGSPGSNDAFTRGNFQNSMTPTFSLGAGYRVNDWLRLEATYQIFKGPGLAAKTQLQCAGALNPVYNYPNAVAGNPGVGVANGYLYQSSTCNGFLNATQFNNTGFANAYVDLGKWWMISPYIGAGVGLNASTISGSLSYYDATTGVAYRGPTFNQTAGVPNIASSLTGVDAYGNKQYTTIAASSGGTLKGLTLQQNWNRSFNSTKFTVAGQLIAGFGVPISQSATLDFGYHIMALDMSNTKNIFQTVNVGVRYDLN
jgi:opacity protein-like surface antigen